MSLRDKIYNKIREKILNGHYKAGETLTESQIAREVGASRTPVREAIRQLELEGLITSIPNKGLIVSEISEQEIEDIFEIRTHIEGLAARRAVENITGKQLENMEEILCLFEFYAKKNDVKKCVELDTEFHNIIFQACKSKPIWNILGNFLHYIQKSRLKSLEKAGRLMEALNEHKEIFKALKNRNPVMAEKAMLNHVKHALENVKNLK